MKTHNKAILATITTLGMVGISNAAIIYEANTTNVTLFNNSGTIPGASSAVSGDSASGDMDLTVTGNNFSFAGFTSTQSINTILGRTLLDTDTVILTFTTGNVNQNGDGGELRSRGFQFGLSATTAADGGASDNQLIIDIGGGGNSGAIALAGGSANSGPGSGGGTISNAEANNGLTMTLTADTNGWSAAFTDAGAITNYTGSFDAGEFTSFFGDGHLYAGFQQRNGSTNGVTVPFEVASIDVTPAPIPEPSSTALLGLGGLALILRRRK